MKAFVVPLLAAVFVLTGCVVVPAEPAVVVSPARAHVRPPTVLFVPGGGYYDYRGERHYHWQPRYRYRD